MFLANNGWLVTASDAGSPSSAITQALLVPSHSAPTREAGHLAEKELVDVPPVAAISENVQPISLAPLIPVKEPTTPARSTVKLCGAFLSV